MQVIVQPDHRAALAVASIALDHLARAGNPPAPVGLDEQSSLVAVHDGLDDEHAGDLRRGGDLRHRYSSSTRLSSPSIMRVAAGRVRDRCTSTSRPINESVKRTTPMMRLRSRTTECSRSLSMISQPEAID